MIQNVAIEEFIEMSRTLPVIDVRTPAEFAKARIPGAINLPLFSDEERVRIGTLYKQTGHREAVLAGLEMVGPRMRAIVEDIDLKAGSKHLLVHCWRGGMRSGSVAWLLDLCGYRVTVLRGGYKAFRRLVLHTFAVPRSLIVLGGKTGSGKTHILHALQRVGEQVVDLEAIAHHKGSSFGRIGETIHPSQEQFENDIAWSLYHTDPSVPVWIEDESRRLGWTRIPDALWQTMCLSPLLFLDLPIEHRINNLIQDYGAFAPSELADALTRISKYLGGLDTRTALEALQAGDLRTVCRIALRYYDKTYLYGLSLRKQTLVKKIETSLQTPESIANLLLDIVRNPQEAS